LKDLDPGLVVHDRFQELALAGHLGCPQQGEERLPGERGGAEGVDPSLDLSPIGLPTTTLLLVG
jgi:hypothetical protein